LMYKQLSILVQGVTMGLLRDKNVRHPICKKREGAGGSGKCINTLE
jgi:hypothetical protein